MIGLRDFNKRYKGCYPHYKIKHFFRELKYAWQRAWKGYDYPAACDISESFRPHLIAILKEKKNINNSPWWTRDADGGLRLSGEDEVNKIFDELINHLTLMDMDEVIKSIYSMELYENMISEDWAKVDYKLVHKLIDEHKAKAFELLFQYWDYL